MEFGVPEVIVTYLHSLLSVGMRNAQHSLIGELYMGSQYHFPMEAHAARVIPTEDGYDVFATSQWPTETQATAAQVLGVPCNK